MRSDLIKAAACGTLAAIVLASGLDRPAHALDVVLNDVAPDRIQRQRSFTRQELPLPGTPDLTRLDERLRAQDLAEGRPIYIRIFKAESELELWMQNGKGTFSRLATYPICHWYGSLGPKLKEGDKQSPEGFYRVGAPQTRLVGRWRKAFNLGFPNLHDQRLNRTGSYILIHGGCSSVGCFAMTDPVQDEIYRLATAALAKGQERFSVHVFPFRMTAENMQRYAGHAGSDTWADLKPAYDSFERTHVPPRIALCGLRYKIADGLPGETGDTGRRLAVLQPAGSAGQGTRSADAADAGETWVAPGCQLDDEDERIAYYTTSPITTAATTTATAEIVPAEPAVAPATPAVAAAAPIEPETETRPVAKAKPASVSESAPVRMARPAPPRTPRAAAPQRASPPRRVHTASRPPSRATASQSRSGAITAADGFGSAGLRGTQRISSSGG
jgi:murein L,D-transpeptidase YafK